MIRNIVVPLDGSQFGEMAAPPALEIARQTGAQLHFVHVLVPLIVADPMMQYSMVEVEGMNEARQYLADMLKRLDVSGLKLAPAAILLDGPVLDAMKTYCSVHKADLVIMATHGRGPFARAIVGSVTNELLREIHVPMLVFPVHGEDAEPATARFRRVLIAIDGTLESEKVLTPAMELAQLSGAESTLLRVIPPQKPVDRTDQPPKVTEFHLGAQHGRTEEAELDRLTGLLRSHKLKAEARMIEHDRPDVAILEEAKRLNCDLIALETHGRSALARLFAGSVTDKVIRGATCPVLVHRAEHQPQKRESAMHSDELVSVFKAPDPVLARIVAADLANEGISCKVTGENQGGFTGVSAIGVEVLVHEDDVDRARKVIRQHEPRPGNEENQP
jgi:nucleotide-binding universal stress UspA family protein